MASIEQVENAVKALVAYGIRTGLIPEEEAVYTANALWDVLGLEPGDDFSVNDAVKEDAALEQILTCLLDDAVSRGRIDDGIASRDLFDTRLMGCLTPRPGEVIRTFRELMKESPEKATDYFYALSCSSDYIRTYRS